MIPFADPLPDELMYSVLARLSNHLGIESAVKFHREILEQHLPYTPFFFPKGLSALESKLPPGTQHSADSLIDEHALLRYFQPFIDDDRQERMRQAMKVYGTEPVHTVLGTVHLTPRVAFIRYCPACVQADRAAYREAYWHRAHHLPAIEVCATHGVWLVDSSVSTGRQHSYIAAERAVEAGEPRPVDTRDPMNDVRLFLAQNATYLLHHAIQSHPDDNRQRILHALVAAGFTTYTREQVEAEQLVLFRPILHFMIFI